jgi:hypothetical protein
MSKDKERLDTAVDCRGHLHEDAANTPTPVCNKDTDLIHKPLEYNKVTPEKNNPREAQGGACGSMGEGTEPCLLQQTGPSAEDIAFREIVYRSLLHITLDLADVKRRLGIS